MKEYLREEIIKKYYFKESLKGRFVIFNNENMGIITYVSKSGKHLTITDLNNMNYNVTIYNFKELNIKVLVNNV